MVSQKPRRRNMANKNLGLLLASVAFLFAGNLQLASAACEDLEAACGDDEACLDCLTYTQTAEGSTATECRTRYPGIWNHSGGEGGYYAAFCESSGAEYCCDFEANTSAETCMNNTVAASYWSCLMDDVGCLVEDMPCYSGAETLLVTMLTPAPVIPTGEPSPHPSSSSPSPSSSSSPSSSPSSSSNSSSSFSSSIPCDPSYFSSSFSSSTASSSSTSSSSSTTTPCSTTWSSSSKSSSSPSSTSSSSSTSSLPECDAEIAECENDETCVECTASTSATHDGYTTECKELYPDNFNYASEGGTWNYCDTQGAYFCCEFETDVFAATCMQNDATANYWDCLLVDAGCSVDHMPCYSGVAVNPGGTSSTSSSGPNASQSPAPVFNTPAPLSPSDGSSDRGLDVTASPSAAGSDASASPADAGDATEDIDTNANGAARIGASSSVLAVGCAVCLLTAIV